MSELLWTGPVEPASLRRALRHALRRRSPELRVVAEQFLAAASPIDLLAVGDEGELVSIRISPTPGAAETARLLTRSLSDLSWLRPRAADLASLAPELGLAAGVEPRALLVAPAFDAELISAVESLPPGRVELVGWCGLRHRGQLELILEPRTPGSDPTPQARPPEPTHCESFRETEPHSPPGFRTGLTDDDLQLPHAGQTH